jgi:hypothetical protein
MAQEIPRRTISDPLVGSAFILLKPGDGGSASKIKFRERSNPLQGSLL